MDCDIFIYKLTADNGGAPCVINDLLSLSICKPRIRKSAKKGDWIIGMGGKSVKDLKGRLIYMAKITSIVDGNKYYSDKYKERPDCIYKKNGRVYIWKKGSSYHSQEDLTHDLGEYPNYDRAICLISDNFVYFGSNKAPSIEDIQDIYDELPRDYRVKHNNCTRERLFRFIENTTSKFGYGKHGDPTHIDMSKKCNLAEGDVLKCTRSC